VDLDRSRTCCRLVKLHFGIHPLLERVGRVLFRRRFPPAYRICPGANRLFPDLL
jgi:hypothetical protein